MVDAERCQALAVELVHIAKRTDGDGFQACRDLLWFDFLDKTVVIGNHLAFIEQDVPEYDLRIRDMEDEQVAEPARKKVL